LFAGFYLLTTTGLTINFHFCSGELVSVSVFSEPKTCCGKTGGMEGCCQNKKITHKIKDGHESLSLLKIPKNSTQDLFVYPALVSVLPYYIQWAPVKEKHRIHAPPEAQPRATWLQTRAILI